MCIRDSTEPFVRAAAGGQRDLEETVQHRVQGPLCVTQGEGLADLVEDLVLAEDRTLKAAGDADEVSGRGGVLKALSAAWKLRELPVAEGVECDIHLDTVAGVYDDHRIIGLQGMALGGERLAGNACL